MSSQLITKEAIEFITKTPEEYCHYISYLITNMMTLTQITIHIQCIK